MERPLILDSTERTDRSELRDRFRCAKSHSGASNSRDRCTGMGSAYSLGVTDGGGSTGFESNRIISGGGGGGGGGWLRRRLHTAQEE